MIRMKRKVKRPPWNARKARLAALALWRAPWGHCRCAPSLLRGTPLCRERRPAQRPVCEYLVKFSAVNAMLHCVAVLWITAAQALGAHAATGSAETNTVWDILLHTDNFLGEMRSNLTGQIRQCLDKPPLGTNDLVELRTATMRLRDQLLRAGTTLQLSNAEQRVRSALANAESKATDPDDRMAFLGQMNLHDFLLRMESRLSAEASLRRDVEHVLGALTASLEVVTALQDVMNGAELSTRIVTRLRGLLAELEKSGMQAGHDSPVSGKQENPSTARAPDGNLPASLSKSVYKVIEMARSGVEEHMILDFIAHSSEPFELNTADKIIALHRAGLSGKILCAMMQRPAPREETLKPEEPIQAGKSPPLVVVRSWRNETGWNLQIKNPSKKKLQIKALRKRSGNKSVQSQFSLTLRAGAEESFTLPYEFATGDELAFICDGFEQPYIFIFHE